MLLGLGLDPFVRCNHHQNDADSTQTCKRVVNETLMPRYVDESYLQIVCEKVGEAEVDSNATTFLFFPPIAVDSCEGLDKCRFAVIDVSGCADNNSPH